MQTSAIEYPDAVPAAAELSHVARLDEITNTASTVVLDANARECASLAARFDLPYVHSLSAEIIYRRARSGQMIRVEGRISAAYGQLCSATQAPMAMTMEEEFQTEYTLSAWEKVSEFDLDQPEVLTDDFIDLGEIAAQYFGLAIDPWARRAGVETLTELADDLTAAARELNGHINGNEIQAEIPLQSLTVVEFAALPEDIKSLEPQLPTAEILYFSPPEMPTDSPFDDETAANPPESSSEPAEPEPRESLFFQYLRRLQNKV